MKDNAYYNKLWEESPMSRIGCGSPIVAIIVVMLILAFSSCATKTKIEYVDREVVKYETKIQHDTLINNIHDSIYHTVFQKGDTIYDTKYVERIRFKDRVVVRTDTVYQQKVKTEIREKTKEVIKIPKWCWYCLGITIIMIIFAVVKMLRWIH